MSITVLDNQHMDQFAVAVLTTWLMNYSDCKKRVNIRQHQSWLLYSKLGLTLHSIDFASAFLSLIEKKVFEDAYYFPKGHKSYADYQNGCECV